MADFRTEPAFQGKVVIITGSSSGIGRETSVQFARRGACLLLTGRDEAALEVTKQLCKSAGAKDDALCTVIADVTKDEDLVRIVRTCTDGFGKIDVVVNNAGGLIGWNSFPETAVDDILKLFQRNTLSAFRLTQEAMPYLEKSKGCVVNVSSIYGHRHIPASYPCTMSKAAMDQFTKCLALEYADKGVRVNSVNPGHIDTPIFITSGLTSDESSKNKLLDGKAKVHPMKRTGLPIEVASAILFLASDQSTFTTGELFPVDGGRAICMEGCLS